MLHNMSNMINWEDTYLKKIQKFCIATAITELGHDWAKTRVLGKQRLWRGC